MNLEKSKPDLLDDPTVHPMLKRVCASIIVEGATLLADAVTAFTKDDVDKPEQLRLYHRLMGDIAYELALSAERALEAAKRMDDKSKATAEAALRKAKERA